MKIRRIAGLKFECVRKAVFSTNIRWTGPSIEIHNPITGELLVEIHPSGWVVIYPGYQCDGPSGPTKDDATNIGPSFLHDALYEVLRAIGEKCFTRKQADQAMYAVLCANVATARKAAMAKAKNKASQALVVTKYALLLARYATWYRGLRWFAFWAARRRKGLEDKYKTIEVM